MVTSKFEVNFMELKRMSLKVPEELYNQISDESDKRGLTMNAVVILALEAYYTQQLDFSALKELIEQVKSKDNQ